jgi:hypothetical protein
MQNPTTGYNFKMKTKKKDFTGQNENHEKKIPSWQH